MRLPALGTLAALVAAGTAPVAAQQVDLAFRLGAQYSSPIVTDVIVGATELELTPDIAPAATAAAALAIAPGYRAGLEATFARGGLTATELDREFDAGTLTTLSALLTLDGPAAGPSLRWRGGIGLVRYLPSEETGVFARGGTTRFLVRAGLEYRRPAFRGWDLSVSAAGDFHQFTTDQLRALRFGGTQGVVRALVGIGLARAAR